MGWKNILKNEEDRLGLEIELEKLVHDWGMDKDMSDYEYFTSGGPYVDGLEINVFFEDNYEGEEGAFAFAFLADLASTKS